MGKSLDTLIAAWRLSSHPNSVLRVPEADGTVSLVLYFKNALGAELCGAYKSALDAMEEEEWDRGYCFGNPIPRLQCWYQEAGYRYKYSGKYWPSHVYPAWLQDLQRCLGGEVARCLEEYQTSTSGVSPPHLNSVLINKYTCNTDSMDKHRDNESMLGDNPTIVSVSLGQRRQFGLWRAAYDASKPDDKKIKLMRDESNSKLNRKFDLGEGDILVMAGSTQKFFVHDVIKQPSSPNKVRYNLTFRPYYLDLAPGGPDGPYGKAKTTAKSKVTPKSTPDGRGKREAIVKEEAAPSRGGSGGRASKRARTNGEP